MTRAGRSQHPSFCRGAPCRRTGQWMGAGPSPAAGRASGTISRGAEPRLRARPGRGPRGAEAVPSRCRPMCSPARRQSAPERFGPPGCAPGRVVRRPPARQPAIPCTSRRSRRVPCRRGGACGGRRRGVLPAGAARRSRGSGGIPALRVGNWHPPVCGNLVENWPNCGANSRQMDVFTRRRTSGVRRLQNTEIKWFSHRCPVYSAVTCPVGQQKCTFWPFCTGVIVLSFKPSAGKRKFPQAGPTVGGECGITVGAIGARPRQRLLGASRGADDWLVPLGVPARLRAPFAPASARAPLRLRCVAGPG